MGAFSSYQPNPLFTEETDLAVTGGLEILQSNTQLVDEATLQGRDALQAHAYANEPTNDNPQQYGQWSFEYRVGLTTLAWIGYNALSSTVVERIRMIAYAPGVAPGAGVTLIDAALASGYQTLTATNLASQGWGDGAVIEVFVELYDTGAPSPELGAGRAWGSYETVEFFVGPLSSVHTTPYPDVPTFTVGSDPATDGPVPAKLNQLGAALDWCAARLALVPRPMFQSITFGTGLYFLDDAGQPIDHQLWRGGVIRGPTNRLRGAMYYDIVANSAETLRLLINGSVVVSHGPLGSGTRGAMPIDVDLSGYAADAALRLELRSRVTGPGGRPSRLSLYGMRVQRATPTPQAQPTAPEPEELASWTTAMTRLNSLCSIVQAAYTRITTDTDLYDRARLYRRNYGYDDGQKAYFETRHLPLVGERRGSRLIVRGKNVKLGYGAASFELLNPKEPDGTYTLKHAVEETLIGGDALATKVVYLDGLKGLDLGTGYVLRGDVRYAAEFLR